MAANDETKTPAVHDRAYFCRLGLSDRGLDPRDRRSLEKLVSRQEVTEEFGSCKAPINLRSARTIDFKFLESLRSKVYRRGGNNGWKTVGLSFARGAIASHRGLQVDWATFAFQAQYRGRWSQGRAALAREDGSKQGDEEIGSNREGEIRREETVACPDLQVEARLVEPGPGSESKKRKSTVLELYDSVMEEINAKRARMSEQVATEMEPASSTKLDSQAALDLQQSDHEPGSDPLSEEWMQAGPSPQVDLNTERQMVVHCEPAAVRESAESSDTSVVDIEPLAGRRQSVESPLEPQATTGCGDAQATTGSGDAQATTGSGLLGEPDNVREKSTGATILQEFQDLLQHCVNVFTFD